MSLLKDLAQKNTSPEAVVGAYVAEVTTRYNRNQIPRHPADRRVKCRWVIEYQSKRETWTTILLMPFFLVLSSALGGHAGLHVIVSKVPFETYHYLSVEAASKLKWSSLLRKWLSALAVFALVLSGFGLVFWLGMLCYSIGLMAFEGMPQDSTGFDPTIAAYVIAPLAVGGLIFAGARSSQLALRKIGRPPDTDVFNDPEIKLISVHVE
jgi:hypothetical protein